MSNGLTSATSSAHPTLYQIRLAGHLGSQWADWFGGLTIILEDNGETVLTGPVADQAALHGLLKKVRDVGLPLIALTRIDPKHANGPDVKPGPR